MVRIGTTNKTNVEIYKSLAEDVDVGHFQKDKKKKKENLMRGSQMILRVEG